MPRFLHLLKTDFISPAVLAVIERQSREPGTEITVVLMHGAPAPPLPSGVIIHRLAENDSSGSITHSRLLDLIFEADSAIAW